MTASVYAHSALDSVTFPELFASKLDHHTHTHTGYRQVISRKATVKQKETTFDVNDVCFRPRNDETSRSHDVKDLVSQKSRSESKVKKKEDEKEGEKEEEKTVPVLQSRQETKS